MIARPRFEALLNLKSAFCGYAYHRGAPVRLMKEIYSNYVISPFYNRVETIRDGVRKE